MRGVAGEVKGEKEALSHTNVQLSQQLQPIRVRRETLLESQGAKTAGSAAPKRAGVPPRTAGSQWRRAVAGLGLGREAPQQAWRPSERPVRRGMQTRGGGHAALSPREAGETRDAPKSI